MPGGSAVWVWGESGGRLFDREGPKAWIDEEPVQAPPRNDWLDLGEGIHVQAQLRSLKVRSAGQGEKSLPLSLYVDGDAVIAFILPWGPQGLIVVSNRGLVLCAKRTLKVWKILAEPSGLPSSVPVDAWAGPEDLWVLYTHRLYRGSWKGLGLALDTGVGSPP